MQASNISSQPWAEVTAGLDQMKRVLKKSLITYIACTYMQTHAYMMQMHVYVSPSLSLMMTRTATTNDDDEPR